MTCEARGKGIQTVYKLLTIVRCWPNPPQRLRVTLSVVAKTLFATAIGEEELATVHATHGPNLAETTAAAFPNGQSNAPVRRDDLTRGSNSTLFQVGGIGERLTNSCQAACRAQGQTFAPGADAGGAAVQGDQPTSSRKTYGRASRSDGYDALALLRYLDLRSKRNFLKSFPNIPEGPVSVKRQL